MELKESTDKPKITDQDTNDKIELQRKLYEVSEARPGTFRYSDIELGGEVWSSAEDQESLQPIAKAEVFRRDGSSEVVGTVRYSVAGDEARIYPGAFNARNHGTEWALLSEVSEQARARGTTRLRIWVPDGDPAAEQRWQAHGFQPIGRNPGAAGVDWEKPL